MFILTIEKRGKRSSYDLDPKANGMKKFPSNTSIKQVALLLQKTAMLKLPLKVPKIIKYLFEIKLEHLLFQELIGKCAKCVVSKLKNTKNLYAFY